MVDHCEEVHIMLLEEEINYNYPFVIIELLQINENFGIKVRYVNNDQNMVRDKYLILKKLIKNPLLIVNSYLSDITENRNDIYKKILNFYNENIKIK